MKPLRGGGVHESGVRDGARGWRMAAARGTARLEEQWQLIHPPNGAVSARRPKTPKRWSALRTERSSAEMASPKAMAQRAGLWRRPKPTTAQAPRPRARYAGGIVLPAASPVSSPCSLLSPVCPGLVQQESCAGFASHNTTLWVRLFFRFLPLHFSLHFFDSLLGDLCTPLLPDRHTFLHYLRQSAQYTLSSRACIESVHSTQVF